MKPFKTIGFKHYDRVASIIGDRAHRQTSFHLSMAKQLSVNNDNNDPQLSHSADEPPPSLMISTSSSGQLTMAALVNDGVVPHLNMDVDEIEVPLNWELTASPITTPPQSAPSENSLRKWKMNSSLAPSVTSIPAMTISHTLGSSKCQKGAVSLHTAVSQGSGGSGRSCSKKHDLKAAEYINLLNGSVECMTNVMENSNLLFLALISAPADEACNCIVAAIQADKSNHFSVEEKGCIIGYIITNPAAMATYEVISDIELHCTWLRNAALI